jgi:tRNA A-37 threonylcarbamoyl transferase component Bud32
MSNDQASVSPTLRFPASLLDVRPRAFLRCTAGRETFAWSCTPASGAPSGVREVIVKRTRASALPRMGARNVRPGGRREHDNLVALCADGIPVPRAISWCEERGELLVRPARSVVVMEKIEHRETLRDRLARCVEGERRLWSEELARIVARLHERGWRHRDLYLQHFLIPWPEAGGGPSLVLIDVGRARREKSPARRWIVKDLAALLHSAPLTVGPRERMQFLTRYLDRRGIGGREGRRRLARAVAAKAARMARHVPRDEHREEPGG